MKVLLINGSPRKAGNTFLALSEVAKTLEAEGIESEIVQLGTQPVRSCIACNSCAAKGENRCVFDDDLCNLVASKMQECDALVIGSPVYYGQPNGGLLSLVQRLFYSAGSYCTVTGNVVMHKRIDSPEQKIELNIPKGCYIVKVGKVVRRVYVR